MAGVFRLSFKFCCGCAINVQSVSMIAVIIPLRLQLPPVSLMETVCFMQVGRFSIPAWTLLCASLFCSKQACMP